MALPPALWHAIVAFIVLNALLVLVAYVTLLERKFAARMQSRIGPYYVGRPHGWLQPIADALKLMMKEDIVPTASDRWVYNLAPIVFLVPCLLIFATIPFAPELGVADLNIGVLFFLAVSSLEIVGLFMGGWGSNNKYALLSAMRAVNQIISYDLPFIFAALVPVLLAGSMQMSAIVAAQQGLWFVAYPVVGQLAFLAFLVATLAAENRVPFDILEAESELVAGFRVEYSGMKFALIQLGEYAHMLGTSFLGALLFLGGWLGPGPAALGPVWFLVKAILIFLVVSVLGTGIPTTAAYVIAVTVGAAAMGNLGVSLLAAHLFVFYYAVLSDLTPPDAVTAFAAANIAGADMFATGIEAFRLGVAGFLVPFAFVYHRELLLKGDWAQIILMSALAAVSAVALASAVVGHAGGPLAGRLRWLCLVAAALLVVRTGLLQTLGLALYAGIVLWSARRGRDALSVSRD